MIRFETAKPAREPKPVRQRQSNSRVRQAGDEALLDKPGFDKRAYQRDYMRRRRAEKPAS